MMEMNVRPLRAEERKYTYAQSQQLTMQTGMVGHLRCDFGSGGGGFFTTWFEAVQSRKTEEFQAELDEVVNALRFDQNYGGLLSGRKAMARCGREQPESAFAGNYTTEYGFRADTGRYAYLLRCNPAKGDYNCYVWCYDRQWLDYHLQKARRGIRFITSDYKETFRLPDGDQIRIRYRNGETLDRTCRYIDEYHLEVGDSLYHSCQFAEILERNGSTAIPLRSSLPGQCYSALPSTGEMILITRGEPGYRLQEAGPADPEKIQQLNGANHVGKAQEAAMLAGCLFGWAVPAADPQSYNAQGRPLPPKQRDRGNAR